MDITLREYERNYADRLTSHKGEYEDNSEKSFFELELNIYTKYFNSLKKVSHFIKTSPKNNLGHYPITSEVGWELEIINKHVFNEIVTKKEAEPEEDEFRGLLFPGDNAPTIEINIKNLNNRIISAKRILEFIHNKLSSQQESDFPKDVTDHGSSKKLEALEPEEKLENPYPQVFSNPHAYEFFEKLHEKYKDTKYPLADYSFIYRIMVLDGFILDSYKPQMFINWLGKDPYHIQLDKIKTLDKCKTDSKIQTYNTIKEMLQIK